MDSKDKQELQERLEYSQEVSGSMELSGRTRGQWAEVLEETDTEVYAYWAQLDDHQPSGYKIVEHDSPEADELDLDLKHMTDGDAK
jgi:predicted acetyltransferase